MSLTRQQSPDNVWFRLSIKPRSLTLKPGHIDSSRGSCACGYFGSVDKKESSRGCREPEILNTKPTISSL